MIEDYFDFYSILGWGIVVLLYILLSIIRKNFYPILAFALFAAIVIGSDFFEQKYLSELLQLLSYIFIGMVYSVSYSHIVTGIKNDYLEHRDELKIIFSGALFAVPLFLFIYLHFNVPSLEKTAYVICSGVFALVAIFAWRNSEKVISENEDRYSESINNRLNDFNRAVLFEQYGNVPVEELSKQFAEMFKQNNISNIQYFSSLYQIYYIYGEYEEALNSLDQMINISQTEENKISKAELSNIHYFKGKCHDALRNHRAALREYSTAHSLGNHRYYLTNRIAALQK